MACPYSCWSGEPNLSPGQTGYGSNRPHRLLEKAKRFPALKTAIVHPCDDVSLLGVKYAAQEGLIIPILIGPESKIRAAAMMAHVSIENYEIITVPHSHAAAAKAVELAGDHKV